MVCKVNLIVFLVSSIFLSVKCELSTYPGLRRKPLRQQVPQSLEEHPDYLSQLMEENARRRLQLQFEQQIELINAIRRQREQQKQLQRFRERQQKELEALNENVEDYYDQNLSAEQQIKNYGFNNGNGKINSYFLKTKPPFAVGPSDPRYYATNDESESVEDDALDQKELEQYQEILPSEFNKNDENNNIENNKDQRLDVVPVLANKPVDSLKLAESANNFHRIKPQNLNNKYSIQAAKGSQTDNSVLREHLSLDSEINYYMVALVSAISAAASVAVLVLGVTWMQKRAKDAGEVEYPAYGVTGPLRDPSPTGDRKLAQSAQMYHYQHQKQQIIAMDKQKAGEGCSNVSDVESDDDNEEGDYTVYECPGLAPTGEMEVKNPLFLDETPATPLNNLGTTQVTLQQPQVNNGKTNVKVANEKKSKKSKK